jgi:hypothetical protein
MWREFLLVHFERLKISRPDFDEANNNVAGGWYRCQPESDRQPTLTLTRETFAFDIDLSSKHCLAIQGLGGNMTKNSKFSSLI